MVFQIRMNVRMVIHVGMEHVLMSLVDMSVLVYKAFFRDRKKHVKVTQSSVYYLQRLVTNSCNNMVCLTFCDVTVENIFTIFPLSLKVKFEFSSVGIHDEAHFVL